MLSGTPRVLRYPAGEFAAGCWARILANWSDSRRIRIISDAGGLVRASRKSVNSARLTPIREANSESLSPTAPAEAARAGPAWRVHWPRDGCEHGSNLSQSVRNAIRRSGFQYLLDLTRGTAVRVSLDGQDDPLPDRDIAALQRGADRHVGQNSTGRSSTGCSVGRVTRLPSLRVWSD